jgi:hypothetical protein
VNDGDFSPWNGQQATRVGARLLEGHVALDHLDDVDAREEILDEGLRNHAQL